MTRKKLASLLKKVDTCRKSQPKAKALEAIAKGLGRKREKRGKEPTWVSAFTDLPPLSIPNHKGRDIPTGTKNSVLDQLENDIDRWEKELSEWEESNDEGSH